MLRYLIARCRPLVAGPDRVAAVSLRPRRSAGWGPVLAGPMRAAGGADVARRAPARPANIEARDRVAGSPPALPGHGRSKQVPRYAYRRLAVAVAVAR